MFSNSVKIAHRRTNIGPAQIAYQVAGDGPPIVLIHGLSGSAHWWARNIRPLAERFRVYVVDLIGFGGSRNRHRFVLDEAAAYLARWMEQVGISRAGLVGHSMGGYIAAELAADHPERVERLVLVDAAALPFDQRISAHMLSLVGELRSLRLDFLPTLLYDALRAGPATLLGATHDLMRADLRPKLARIQTPTLVVWGERDTLVPLASGKQLSQYVRSPELLVIKGAGHNPMWDCPRAFNREVAAFLAGEQHGPAQSEVECSPAAQPESRRAIQRGANTRLSRAR